MVPLVSQLFRRNARLRPHSIEEITEMGPYYWLGERPCHSPLAAAKSMQGMQFFRFIFLARSWAADRDVLNSRLSELAAHHLVRYDLKSPTCSNIPLSDDNI